MDHAAMKDGGVATSINPRPSKIRVAHMSDMSPGTPRRRCRSLYMDAMSSEIGSEQHEDVVDAIGGSEQDVYSETVMVALDTPRPGEEGAAAGHGVVHAYLRAALGLDTGALEDEEATS